MNFRQIPGMDLNDEARNCVTHAAGDGLTGTLAQWNRLVCLVASKMSSFYYHGLAVARGEADMGIMALNASNPITVMIESRYGDYSRVLKLSNCEIITSASDSLAAPVPILFRGSIDSDVTTKK